MKGVESAAQLQRWTRVAERSERRPRLARPQLRCAGATGECRRLHGNEPSSWVSRLGRDYDTGDECRTAAPAAYEMIMQFQSGRAWSTGVEPRLIWVSLSVRGRFTPLHARVSFSRRTFHSPSV